MRRSKARWLAKVFTATSAVIMLPASSLGTSIIIDIGPGRIIIVADSRVVERNSRGGTTGRDNQCKIIVAGNRFAFAETGNEGYTREGSKDFVPEFHGTAEAVRAYTNVPDHDLHSMAETWARQLTNDFQIFYFADSQRLRRLSIQGIILLGIFAGGSRRGELTAYTAKIEIDDTLQTREGASIPVGYVVEEFPPKSSSIGQYSTNAVTQELLDGSTVRARKAARLWEEKSRGVRKADLTIRRLEFLIEQSGLYDSEVGGPINAVLVTPDSATWIERTTCKPTAISP